MRGLSLTPPWSTLVACGAKGWETRSWQTPYRGNIAIHATKGFPRWARDLCTEEPFRTALMRAGFDTPDLLPRGGIIAVARLDSILRITLDTRPDWPEREFGDYTLGRFMWRLTDIRPIPMIAVRGALGLWRLDAADAARLYAALSATCALH